MFSFRRTQTPDGEISRCKMNDDAIFILIKEEKKEEKKKRKENLKNFFTSPFHQLIYIFIYKIIL